MSRFYREFFAENPAGATDLAFFAFGKHPGWDDHIEGLGIHNQTLALFHSLFYVNGIRSVIDSGIWEQTDPVKVIPEFGNLILWQGRKGFILCRMWPSQDGKGRKKYPMIVGVTGGGVSILQAAPLLFPVLEKVQTECERARTSEEVWEILARVAAETKATIGTLGGGEVVPGLGGEDLWKWMETDSLPEGENGWLRILYSMNNQLCPFAGARFHLKTIGEGAGESLRVPQLESTAEESLVQWLRFFRGEIHPQVPIFLTALPDRNWVDVIVGEPVSQDFGCLKLNLEGIPLVNTVPFNLPEAFHAWGRAFLERRKNDGGGEPGGFLADVSLADEEKGKSGGWLKKLFGGGG